MRKAITSAFIACLILASVLTISVVTAQPAEKVPVIVGFKDKPDAELIQAHGGRIKCVYNIIPAIACELPEPAIDALRKNPKVAYVEADGVVEAIGEVLPWGVDRIDAEVVHPYNKGTAVKVAIIDTGIDYIHPDLNDNYKGGYDFVNNYADPKDDHGHGTHCAGIVAAEDNEIGVIGVAPEAYLYAVKVLNNQGSGYLSNVILGIQWSVANRMQVISMSLGTSTYSQSLKDACDNAYTAGLVLVAAAGNSGDGNPATDEYSYPAAYDSVIAVGATDISNTAPTWSNSGLYLELAAPGVSIYSTLPTYRVTLTRTYGYSYGTLSGTSMSCPHVAGTVALVIASGQTLTNVGVRTLLQTTADDLGPMGWDTVYGCGIVDADEAAPLTGPPNQPPVADANGPYTGTEDVAITFNGLGSYDPDGDPLTYAWSFGDGNTGTGVNPTHVYTAGETYTVTLVVNDGKVDSEPSYSTATITEVNDSPIADAGPDQTATVNEVITFDGSGSTDPEGNIASYAWDFGDGISGTGITVTHAYSTAGTYTVTLTVTDDGGLTDSDTAIVTVTEAPAVPTMHVSSIEMSTGSRTVGRNKFVWATATVTIVDANGVSVKGATVYGHWESATTDSDSGITDASGKVSLQSDSVKNPPSGTTFKFVVDRVELSGWTYNSSANVETSDSITV